MQKPQSSYVLITGTLHDAPDLREAAVEACHRLSIAPRLLEPVPNQVTDQDAHRLFEAAFRDAGLYLGVYGPHPYEGAEAEYEQAVTMGLPRLIFLSDASQTNGGADAAGYEAFKSRLQGAERVSYYKTPAELRAGLINRLAEYHELDLAALHYTGKIPRPPEPYIAHPYTLLPSGRTIGRKTQLDLLTEWATDPEHNIRALSIVAIGGMGKSALTWKWFNEIAPQVMPDLAGRVWWSFYESDAYFENFVIRTLAYITKMPPEEIREITAPERERELLELLDTQPYLIVLDGLERILISYARLDAARLDDESLDATTANAVAGALGVPPESQPAVFSPNRLRKTADPRAGAFLRKLAGVRASRTLISTRLYPADLQHASGYPTPGSAALFLAGLEADETLALWQSFGVSGSREELLPMFATFGNYPLLIRALAGEIARAAGGDFATWRRAHPNFAPERQSAEAVKSHVMGYALAGLSAEARRTLDTIAAFRMPTPYDALVSLLVGTEPATDESKKPAGGLGRLFRREKRDEALAKLPDQAALDAILAELEGRGLIGWDRRANRYDLHPIVRNVAWNALDERARHGLYSTLNAHFGALPAISAEDVRSLEDLTAPIELYNTLIGLGKYDEAFALYTERLNTPMIRRLGASTQRIELLELLFPDGLEKLPALGRPAAQARALNSLALAYGQSGQPARAAPLYLRATNLTEREGNFKNVVIGLCNLAESLRLIGQLRAAAAAAYQALALTRAQADSVGEVLALQITGLIEQARGLYPRAEAAFGRAQRLAAAANNTQARGISTAFLAQLALIRGDRDKARAEAAQALELAEAASHESDMVRALSLRAASEGDLDGLTSALTRARAANLVEQELAALIRLAALRRERGELPLAKATLEDLWEAAERGPYRLLHAEAYNLLTAIERESGELEAAQSTAKAAYYLAWCDGEPFAASAELNQARTYLQALSMQEPDDLPPFDPAAHGPLMEVEIEPAE